VQLIEFAQVTDSAFEGLFAGPLPEEAGTDSDEKASDGDSGEH
jgi:hypothetical protein